MINLSFKELYELKIVYYINILINQTKYNKYMKIIPKKINLSCIFDTEK